MSRALSPNFTLPPLSVAPSGRGLSRESLCAANEELCSLVVEATVDGRRLALELSDSEFRDWHVEAAKRNVPLVALRSHGTVELYSTQGGASRAWSHALKELAKWSRIHPELGELRVTVRRGPDVAAHLFASVAGLGVTRLSTNVELGWVERSIQLASRAGSLGHTLGSLFRAALKVGRRVAVEALEGNPEPSEALREMASIGAARIVDEELLFWKAEQRNLCRALSRRGAGHLISVHTKRRQGRTLNGHFASDAYATRA